MEEEQEEEQGVEEQEEEEGEGVEEEAEVLQLMPAGATRGVHLAPLNEGETGQKEALVSWACKFVHISFCTLYTVKYRDTVLMPPILEVLEVL